jgi:hypothetical protein
LHIAAAVTLHAVNRARQLHCQAAILRKQELSLSLDAAAAAAKQHSVVVAAAVVVAAVATTHTHMYTAAPVATGEVVRTETTAATTAVTAVAITHFSTNNKKYAAAVQ